MSDKVKNGLVTIYLVVSAGVLAFYAYKWMTNPIAVVPKGESVAHWVPILAAGRNLAVAAVTILLIILKKREALGFVVLTWGLIELYDAFTGIYVGVASAAIAPFVNSFLLLLASWYLISHKNPQS